MSVMDREVFVMAMTVKNNMSAVRALNILNNNSSAFHKSLERLSTGQKIVGVKDNSSAYAISEKMRTQIRTLDQDSRNIQNGSALLKIAAGGINSIIDELRNLKELAIKSVNDTNSDNDRGTIQKEFSQRVANIEELVFSTNYNGITLMGGDYGIRVGGKLPPQGDLSDLTKSFTPYSNASVSSNLQSMCRLNGSYLQAQHSFTGSGNFSVDVNFSGLNAGSNVAGALDGKGFIILCGGCGQYLNMKFDASTDSSSYNNSPDPSNTQAREYKIGIKSLTSLSQLPEFMFNGIKSSNPANASATNVVQIDTSHSVNMEKTADGKYIISKNGPALQFLTGAVEGGNVTVIEDNIEGDPEGPWEPKVYSPFKIHHGAKSNQAMNVYLNDMSLKYLRKRVIWDADIEQLEKFANDTEKYNSYKNYLVSEKRCKLRRY